MMQNVAVFFGGNSAEREISVLTGVLALRMIDPAKYRAVPVYIHSDGDFYTAPEAFSLDVFKAQPFPLHKFSRCYFQRGELLIVPPKKHRVKTRVQISVAINCCHGGAGENGGVSALCELYGIPSASPSVAACAVAMDKELTKFFMHSAGVPVIMLSARGEEYDKLFAFEIGVDDYVTKPFSPKEVMARINAVTKRKAAKQKQDESRVIRFEGLEIDMAGRNVYVDGEKAVLTPKEYELLFYFVRNQGLALTREKLLYDVWGFDFYGDDRTVDTHVKMLRGNLKQYRKFIVTLRGLGYKFEADGE